MPLAPLLAAVRWVLLLRCIETHNRTLCPPCQIFGAIVVMSAFGAMATVSFGNLLVVHLKLTPLTFPFQVRPARSPLAFRCLLAASWMSIACCCCCCALRAACAVCVHAMYPSAACPVLTPALLFHRTDHDVAVAAGRAKLRLLPRQRASAAAGAGAFVLLLYLLLARCLSPVVAATPPIRCCLPWVRRGLTRFLSSSVLQHAVPKALPEFSSVDYDFTECLAVRARSVLLLLADTNRDLASSPADTHREFAWFVLPCRRFCAT